MPSSVAGFEYDIFISYRHNDNRSGWVSDFVAALQEELGSTIKHPVFIYFDRNPHDGLQETHNVDRSLEKKLKCLVFIPIVSQTYCDTESFAWKDEFVPFVKMAKEDHLGLEVALLNGNVCSRILPVQIHELDAEDRELIQSQTGSVLRAIEFIYRAPGVKRPLLPKEENPSANLNKTSYRDQINKVANSIKEILSAIKKSPEKKINQDQKTSIEKNAHGPARKIVVASLLVIIITTVFLTAMKWWTEIEDVEIGKSIAVLPFDDMSPDKDQEYLGDGIAEEVITALSRIKELKVIGRTSSFQFKGDKVDLRHIGEKLDVATVLEGSVQKSGNNVRITAQLIRVSDGSHIWSERYERDITDIFAILDEISSHIAEKLKLTLFEGEKTPTANVPTKNIEAYELCLKGNHFLRQGPKGRDMAVKFFQQAIAVDSTYADAYIGVAWGYFFEFKNNREWLGRVRDAVENAIDHNIGDDRASELMLGVYMYEWNWSAAKREYDRWFASNDEGTVSHAVFLRMAYADHPAAIKILQGIVRKDPLNIEALRILGYCLSNNRQYDEARRVHEKILEIDPAYGDAYLSIGWIYCLEGNYRLAYKNYDIAQTMLPASSRILPAFRIMTLAYDNRKAEALKEFQQFKELYKDYNTVQAEILFALGDADEAFHQLEIAYERRDPRLVYLRTNHAYDEYRSDKRFQALMQKINFPEK